MYLKIFPIKQARDVIGWVTYRYGGSWHQSCWGILCFIDSNVCLPEKEVIEARKCCGGSVTLLHTYHDCDCVVVVAGLWPLWPCCGCEWKLQFLVGCHCHGVVVAEGLLQFQMFCLCNLAMVVEELSFWLGCCWGEQGCRVAQGHERWATVVASSRDGGTVRNWLSFLAYG